MDLEALGPDKTIPNVIAFNGEIITSPVEVAKGLYGFKILAGNDKLEMPIIIARRGNEFEKGDYISAFGRLEKINDDWIISVHQIGKIPTQEELNNMTEEQIKQYLGEIDDRGTSRYNA